MSYDMWYLLSQITKFKTESEDTMVKYKVTLTQDERDQLEEITRKGSHRSQKVLNALILLNCDRGSCQDHSTRNEDVASVLKVSMRKIDRLKKRFVQDGLQMALDGRKGERAYAKKADGDFEAHLVALSCSKPPEGFCRWSLRLLADQVVKLEYIESVSYETVRRVLKKTRSSLGKGKDGSFRPNTTATL